MLFYIKYAIFIPSVKSEHHPSFNSRRLFSVEIEEMSGDTKLLDYEQLLEAQKDEDCLIIDVREQNEINETGKLPGSIHIPSNLLFKKKKKKKTKLFDNFWSLLL